MASEIRTILKTCSTCKLSFDTLRELIDHEKSHRPGHTPIKNAQPTKMASEITYQLLEKRRTYQNEYNRAYSKGFFRCGYCDKTFLSRDGCKRHKTAFHSEKLLKGDRVADGECFDVTLDSIHRATYDQSLKAVSEMPTRLLEKRRIADRNQTKGFWPCAYCDKVYFTHNGYYQHKTSMHKSLIRIKLTCNRDANDEFEPTQSQETEAPLLSLTATAGVNCKYCLATFPSRRFLQEHEKDVHSTGKRLFYFCAKCPKIVRPYFWNENELLAHAAKKHTEIDQADMEVTTSAWTTVVKSEPIDNEAFAETGTTETGKVKMEPSEEYNDQELLGENGRQKATNLGNIVASFDGNVNDDDSHYFCQSVATFLRRLDSDASIRARADIERILQSAIDGRNWTLVDDGDTT